MIPANRGRKARKSKQTAGRLTAVGPAESCDCPACTGEDVDPSGIIDDMLADVADLARHDDPLAVEYAAAMFVAMCQLAGEGYEDALADGFVPEFEARADTAALIMLRAIGSVHDGRVGEAATAAADRLAGAGVVPPGWVAELREPVTAGDCWRLADPAGTGSMLVCSFHRSGRAHAIMVSVDHTDCGAAANITLLDTAGLPQAMDLLGHAGVAADRESLDPAELRWQVETALDARAVHDGDAGEPPFDDENGLPDYYPLAVLLRSRMRALPDSGKPKDKHAGMITFSTSVPGLLGARSRTAPPKPKPRGGPAPVYRIKVGLRGAKPPIWRRLEVPADTSLAGLHAIIQVAFGWDGSHLHAFETPYGDYGIPDPELGHQPADSVTLEQVLPGDRAKITYTYDFGDDWRHDILVEQVLTPDPSASYPRCTGGRRATPPEDCGGIWSYTYLLEVLADPSHPDHQDRLDWLGLDDAAQFNPAAFDPAAVTEALSHLR